MYIDYQGQRIEREQYDKLPFPPLRASFEIEQTVLSKQVDSCCKHKEIEPVKQKIPKGGEDAKVCIERCGEEWRGGGDGAFKRKAEEP